MGSTFPCPECSGELAVIAGICNLHVTGDDRIVNLLQCVSCSRWFLSEWVDAWLSTYVDVVERDLGPLADKDAQDLLKEMNECPEPYSKWCRCPAHGTAEGLISRLPVRNSRSEQRDV